MERMRVGGCPRDVRRGVATQRRQWTTIQTGAHAGYGRSRWGQAQADIGDGRVPQSIVGGGCGGYGYGYGGGGGV